LLCIIDPITSKLSESYGSMHQWEYALNTIKELSSWSDYAEKVFGGVDILDLYLSKWKTYDNNKKWMFFILLKLFGSSNCG